MVSTEAITKTHAKGYIAAWLGWAFDGLDSTLFILIGLPFVTQLMGGDSVAAKGNASLIQAFFLFGWALGGAVFGRIGDKIGRSRTLMLTVLIYAAFTGLSSFATEWWHLLIFRFISALGIGGEWAAGSALVSETFHAKHKAWASALLQTGYQVGMMLASLTLAVFPALLIRLGLVQHTVQAYRWLFLVGVTPAILTLWIRRAVPEPEAWQEARESEQLPRVRDLFAPAVLPTTLKALGLLSLALTAVWAFLYFNSLVIRSLSEVKSMAPAAADALIARFTVVWLVWNIVGNFVAGYLARSIGARWTFALFMGAAAVCGWVGFSHPLPLGPTMMWVNVTAFFALGIFGLFPLYVPPLFPTLLRTTGAGFCYNMGRVAAGIGTLVAGQVVGRLAVGVPIAYASLLFIPAMILAFFMPA